MKKLINKYFSLIGVENEGGKRLIIVINVLLTLMSPIFLGGSLSDTIYLLFFLGGVDESSTFYFYLLLFFPIISIIVGGCVKIYFWVKEGFSKNID